ncbi:response regulator [Pseudoroseomonas rhizosphaerae]|uniref:Response regulator n=1 Tax=Teichococcus rhizosphaerae TaxID=1335062 RepID=A0A2C7A9F5_9PROT|nr:response regulator [Pseudoroseomonas rhizosphaerae]PHK93237.1 response regulator [Pseudoroseomonas rhizosphaerae]
MRILVVEDEVLIAMVLREALETAEHEVMGPAATLDEALALCEAERPELALLDINLRDGSSGVELARILRRRWNILSIFVSGQILEARGARDFALGAIGKPYETRTVLRTIEMVRAMMQGEQPRSIPAGLELFGAARPGSATI